jgi:hypothetical protein
VGSVRALSGQWLGATLARLAAALFPYEPERGIYNNALLERDLAAGARADALDAMEAAYAKSGVGRFAAWVHETDVPMRCALEARGYTFDTQTRAMGLVLDQFQLDYPRLAVGTVTWPRR